MHSALLLFWCLSLFGAELTQLRQLEGTKRIFELRRALDRPPEQDELEIRYYRAVMAARFGQEEAAVQQLRALLAAGADPKMELKEHEELASALARLGQYGNAAFEWSEMLRLMANDDLAREGTENTRSLYESLRDVVPQTIEIGPDVLVKAARNPVGSWNVPVSANGHKGEWIFDTGANISTLSESEALRMGLVIREADASVSSDHTGIKTPLRLAVAGDLNFGPAHLHNVIFLILTDDALRFGKFQIHGLLGLPVLRALGCIDISSKGVVRIQKDSGKSGGNPNLFFEELSAIVEVSHHEHVRQMLLDTGANKGYLYPSFLDALAPEERRN